MRKLLLVLCLLALGRDGLADVAHAGSGTHGNQSDTGAETGSAAGYTVDAGASCLIAFLHTEVTVTGAAINWDEGGTPQAMSSEGSAASSGGRQIYIFSLANPTSGNKTGTATWTTSSAWGLEFIAFSGANTADCGNNFTSATGATATPAVTVTGSATGATVGGFSNANTFTSVDSGTTIFTNAILPSSASSYILGGGSNAHNFTKSSTTGWAAAGIHIPAATSSGCGVIGGGIIRGGC